MSARPGHEGWPSWVPSVFATIALITGVAVIAERQANGQDLSSALAYAGLVLAPFILDEIAILTRSPIALPRILFPIPVLAGMVVLIARSDDLSFAPFVLVFLCAKMATESDRPTLGIVVTIASSALMVFGDASGPHDDSFVWIIGITFGWFGGFSVQILAKQTFALKKANAELGEKAAAEERQRIAREVHDVIAHSLSVTMLHITAARMALEKGTLEPALDSLREAEQQGRRSLTEIRRTVGLLGPDESASAPPMPDITDLPELVADFRNAGLDVALSLDGDVTSLPPATGLGVYRIVQESLTNAAKHAPGAKARVDVAVTDDDIRVCVRNDRPNGSFRQPSEGGLGLRGMVERAALLGGTLAADGDEDGWTVVLNAPRQPAPT